MTDPARSQIAIYVAEAVNRSFAGPRAALPDGYVLERFVPRLGCLHDAGDDRAPPLLLYAFWYLFSRGRYRIHYVRFAGRIVHASHELTTNPKISFMKGADLEIGPCWTDPAHGRRGIYTTVLRTILDYHRERRVWIFAQEDNSASRRGIVAAGFAYAGLGEKRCGIYRFLSPGVADQPR